MIYSLEGLRGIAALIVALFHGNGWSSVFTTWPLVRNGWVFVDLFFVISGFVMSHVYRHQLNSRANVVSFLIKRFGRLYPLHIVMLFAFIACEYALQIVKLAAAHAGHPIGSNSPTFDLIKPWSLLSNILLLHSMGLPGERAYNAPSWSISTEVWAYVAFALSVWLVGSGEGRRRVLLWIALSLFGLSVCLSLRRPSIDITTDFGWFRCIYGFFLGALLPPIRDRLSSAAGSRMVSLAQIATLILSIACVWIADQTPSITFALPIVFATLVLSLSFDSNLVAKWLHWSPVQTLGRLSYSIYMVHYSLLVFMNPLGEKLHEPYRSMLRIVYVALLLLAAHLTYRTIEVPWRERFRLYAGRAKRWLSAAKQEPVTGVGDR